MTWTSSFIPPDNTAAAGSDQVRQGFFDELVPYVGLGFARQVPGSLDNLYSTGTSESVFSGPENHFKRLRAVKFRGVGDDDVKEKQLHAVGYMVELAYDLALSSTFNVSRSPGFETILGIFGNQSSD